MAETRAGDLDDLPQAGKKEGSVTMPAALRSDRKNFRRLVRTPTGPLGKKIILLACLNECFRVAPSQRGLQRSREF